MVTSRYPFGAPNCHTINGNNSVQPILYNGYDHPRVIHLEIQFASPLMVPILVQHFYIMIYDHIWIIHFAFQIATPLMSHPHQYYTN